MSGKLPNKLEDLTCLFAEFGQLADKYNGKEYNYSFI